MKQCSRVGIPMEQPFTYIWLLVQPEHNWLNSLSNSLNETKNSLAQNFYLLQGEDFPIFWYLQVTDRWRWEFRTVITPLDFSDLNEILLENIINIIKTLALPSSWTPIYKLHFLWKALELTADIHINFCQLSWNRYSVPYLESYVLKIALVEGRLWLPITKQSEIEGLNPTKFWINE